MNQGRVRVVQMTNAGDFVLMRFFFASTFVIISSSAAAQSMNLDALIKSASERSETMLSAEKTIQAVRSEISGRDLVLSPQFNAEIASIRENKASILPQNRYRSQLLTTSLTKLFSTGTQLTGTVSNEYIENTTFGQRDVGSWELRVSQSLWRDGFGRATTYRHDAEKEELRARTLAAVFQRQNFLVDLEAAYWDLLLARRQLEISKTNLDRSATVEKWTRDRVRRSVAEQTDLLQAQALTGARELELRSLTSQILTLENRIRQLVPGLLPDSWQVDSKELEKARSLDSLIVGDAGEREPVRLDSLSSTYQSRQATAEARRTSELLNPRLDAYASYGQSGADQNFGSAWEQSADPGFATSRIGVQFSIDLDWSLRNDQRLAAQLNAEARELQAQQQMRLSQVGWVDLNRQIEDLKKQAEDATRLAQINEKKVRAERGRYRLGRTTTFQLVTFEIDASNAQLTLSRILADLRKAEGQARIFTRMRDGI